MLETGCAVVKERFYSANAGQRSQFCGDVTGTALMLDPGSLFMNWKGTNFNQGNAPISGTASGGASCTFTMDWTSLTVGGPFNGQSGTNAVGGTHAVVPLPAAV
jgi:hypothetical protein